jgi:hypothetical protein
MGQCQTDVFLPRTGVASAYSPRSRIQRSLARGPVRELGDGTSIRFAHNLYAFLSALGCSRFPWPTSRARCKSPLRVPDLAKQFGPHHFEAWCGERDVDNRA